MSLTQDLWSMGDRAEPMGVTERVVSLIDGRWSLAVLAELQDGGRRYQELDEALDGISHKVLTDTLRRAERTAWSYVTSIQAESTPPPSTS